MRTASVGGAVALFCVATSVTAATFTVTRFDDPPPGACQPDDCSLREAAIAANANTVADLILLQSGNYVLTIPAGANDEATGDIDLTADDVVTIRGVNRLQTTIRAQNGDRVFEARAARFEDLGITGGSATNGAGVYAPDVVDVDFDRVRIFDNTASAFGGGLWFNTSSTTPVSATMTATAIFNNTANNGSAVSCLGANLTCRFRFADIYLNNANFQAAINVANANRLSIEFSSINNNQSGSWPGGINIGQTPASFINTTISGNNADATAGGSGGGAVSVAGDFPFSARHLTMTGNTSSSGPDGINFSNGVSASFRASVLDDDCAFSSGAVTDTAIATIETGNTCGLSGGEDVAINVSSQALALSSLEDNGGWGASHALANSSLARSFVPPDDCTFPLRDQRGAERYPAECDAGAYQTAPCSFPGATIPDNDIAGITNELVIEEDYRIDRMSLFLGIRHTYVGDLSVELEHVESGLSATIIDRPGSTSCSGDDLFIDFDDGASDADDECLSSGGQAFANETYGTTDALSVFDGLSTVGTWRLTVVDSAAQDIGTLERWCLLDPGTRVNVFSDRFE
jgi:hypothetical protein